MNSRKVIGTFLCLFLALATSYAIALGQDDPAAYRLITSDPENSPSYPPDMAISQSGCDCACDSGCSDSGCYRSRCCPRWTATADFIIFDRIGSKTQTLVFQERYDEDGTTGNQLLNANDFHLGFYGGPRVSLIRHGDRCFDLELLYFQIDGWSSSRLVVPDLDEQEGIAFNLPGYEIYSYNYPMQFTYSSKLYNAELNVRWNPLCRLTMLAGFRWTELRENLDGGLLAPLFEPFWNTSTKNNLYGFQIGADAILWERGCFSIDGLLKAGIYGNHAEQRSSLQFDTYDGSASASTNHTAFLGEVGLQCKYQVTKYLTLRAGYEALWLDGVALASGQIPVTTFLDHQAGIDAKGTVFYHGATAGFEYCF